MQGLRDVPGAHGNKAMVAYVNFTSSQILKCFCNNCNFEQPSPRQCLLQVSNMKG